MFAHDNLMSVHIYSPTYGWAQYVDVQSCLLGTQVLCRVDSHYIVAGSLEVIMWLESAPEARSVNVCHWTSFALYTTFCFVFVFVITIKVTLLYSRVCFLEFTLPAEVRTIRAMVSEPLVVAVALGSSAVMTGITVNHRKPHPEATSDLEVNHTNSNGYQPDPRPCRAGYASR